MKEFEHYIFLYKDEFIDSLPWVWDARGIIRGLQIGKMGRCETRAEAIKSIFDEFDRIERASNEAMQNILDMEEKANETLQTVRGVREGD